MIMVASLSLIRCVTASAVRFLKNSEVKQEFTHVATLEENSYIEAFRSILEHNVIERNVFDSYYEAKEMLGRYFFRYNNHRLHRSIGFITPQHKWEEAAVIHDTTFSENLSS